MENSKKDEGSKRRRERRRKEIERENEGRKGRKGQWRRRLISVRGRGGRKRKNKEGGDEFCIYGKERRKERTGRGKERKREE